MAEETISRELKYQQLDAYLMTVFQQLEGIADIEEAQLTLRAFLQSAVGRRLTRDLEEFLYELFFAKCRKYYLESTE